MKGSRFSEEQIIGLLKQQEVGKTVEVICREQGISQGTFYKWKSRFGGMSVDEAKRARQLEEENNKLKKHAHSWAPGRGDVGQRRPQGLALKKLVKPAAKREAVQHLQVQHGFSQRRACQLTKSQRATIRYISRRSDDGSLRQRLRELAHEHPRFGYKRLCVLLRREKFVINHKKVYRLYCEEKLKLRPKRGRKLKSELRGEPQAPSGPNQIWTMDFVSDALWDGRRFRILNVVDAYTRQCLHIEVDTSLTGERVARVLSALVQEHGTPQLLQIDNGPEFRGKDLDRVPLGRGLSEYGEVALHPTG